MPAAPTTPLAFDEIVVDFAGRRLLRAGEPVTLEPKAFDVLVLLVTSPGQALTRDQILDAVWGHRHVTPGVLNRIMTLLRHALGEDAATPRYLHTLHGVGYRFDLPSPAVPSAVEPLQHLPTQERPEGERRAEIGRRKVAKSSVSRPWTWLAIVVSLAAGLLVWTTWHTGTSPKAIPAANSAPAGSPTLIVMPLAAIGDQDSSRDIAAGLSDELITELSLVPGLQVIARESTALAAAGQAGVPGLVPRLGISHALEGSLRQSGEQLRVHMRLTEARSGKTLWAQDYDRPAKDVLGLQRDIARSVATALALKLGLRPEPVPRGADADFLHRYFAARARLRLVNSTSGDLIDQAEAEFRGLVRERPEDSRAHAGLALALDIRAFRRPALAEQLRVEAGEEAELALRLDPELADAWGVKATAACRAEHWEDCLSWLRKTSQLAPGEAQPKFEYALALATLGYLDRAEALMRESMARDPLNTLWRFGLARVLDTQGRHKEAQEQFRQSQGQAIYGRWFNAVWRGDFAEAEAVCAELDSSTPPRDYERVLKPSYVAVTEALQDPTKWPQARAAMDETERSTGLVNFLRAFDPAVDPGKLMRDLRVVRRRSYSTWDLLLWSRELAFLRKDPSFQAELRSDGTMAYWQQHGFPPQCRKTAQGADCR